LDENQGRIRKLWNSNEKIEFPEISTSENRSESPMFGAKKKRAIQREPHANYYISN